MQDPNITVCQHCNSVLVGHHGEFPIAAFEEWDTISQMFFTSPNWMLQRVGVKMQNIKKFYKISICLVGLEIRKITEIIAIYYTVKYSANSNVTCKSEIELKKKLSTRISALNNYPQTRGLVKDLRNLKDRGNTIAHDLDVTNSVSEDGKFQIVSAAYILLSKFVKELEHPDSRCKFHYYTLTGCNRQNNNNNNNPNNNCRFAH